jgi:hypothetical protein
MESSFKLSILIIITITITITIIITMIGYIYIYVALVNALFFSMQHVRYNRQLLENNDSASHFPNT